MPGSPTAMATSLQAVDFLHARNIVHRQLSPNNLMWFPAQQRWKLIDFSAWARSEEDVPLHYALRYAAPELLVADLHGVSAAFMLAAVKARGEVREGFQPLASWAGTLLSLRCRCTVIQTDSLKLIGALQRRASNVLALIWMRNFHTACLPGSQLSVCCSIAL